MIKYINAWYKFLIIATLTIGVAGCENPAEKIQSDKQRFGLLSTSRVIGSDCYEGDSASVQRRKTHPYGPTGGWQKDFLIDLNRTRKLTVNQIEEIGGKFLGYVSFPTEGELRTRSYDDVYGEVYCGWASASINVPKSESHVFVEVAPCVVGDGGLDQVQEICWFPEGENKGIIVFSTAHNNRAETKNDAPLGPSAFYKKELIGNQSYFNEGEFWRLFTDAIRRSEISLGKQILRDATEIVESLEGAIAGTSGKTISSTEFHAQERFFLYQIHLGFALGSEDFDSWLSKIEALKGTRADLSSFEKMLPFYRWLNARLMGKSEPTITREDMETVGVSGHDPRVVSMILGLGEINSNHSSYPREESSTAFWRGAKSLTDGDCPGAIASFSQFLSQDNLYSAFGLELAAASNLENRCLLLP